MTYITAVLLFVFGLSPSSDKIDYNVTNPNTSTNVQSTNTVIVRNPSNNNVVTTNYGDYQSIENIMLPFYMELPAQKLEFKTTSVE